MSFRHLLLLGCCLGSIQPAAAQLKPADKQSQTATQPRFTFPEPGMQLTQTGAPPVLKYMMDAGSTLVSLGEVTPNTGIIGYLAESTDGIFQTFYVMPDGITLIAGIAFRLVNGSPQATIENVTSHQVADMRGRLDASRQSAEESRRRAVEIAETARKRADDAVQVQRGRIEELEERTQRADAAQRQLERAAPVSPPVPSTVTTPAPRVPTPPLDTPPAAAAVLPRADVAPPAQLPQTQVATADNGPIPVSAVNKDEFLEALNDKKMSWFDLGPAAAPMLVMVLDPKCPFCHRAWSVIGPMITERRLRARIVLISATPDSEAATISLLSKPGTELGKAFWMGQGSAPSQPIDAPPPVGSPEYAAGIEALKVHMAFVEKFGQSIRRTPFLAYVATDGKLRSLDGIDGLERFLRGMPPSPALTIVR